MKGTDELAVTQRGAAEPGGNLDRLDRIARASKARQDGRALELARALRAQILSASTTPDPEVLGWAVYYEVRSLYQLGRHADGLSLVVSSPPATFTMPAKNGAWLYAAAAEMALYAGHADQILAFTIRALDLRLADRDRDGAAMVCESGFGLLAAARRADLVSRLVDHLANLWRLAPAGSPAAVYAALVAARVASTGWFIDALPAPEAFYLTLDLHEAAASGHLPEVEDLLARGASPNSHNPRSPGLPTALAAAAFNGHALVIDRLVEAGARVDAVNVQGRTALHHAADQDHRSSVRMLCAAGATRDVADFQGHTPLHVAAWQGHVGPVRALIASGADLEAIDINGNTPLAAAASEPVPQVLSELIRAGVLVQHANRQNQTPLTRAAISGQAHNVRLLLAAGADPNCRDGSRMTAAEWAEREGHDHILGWLPAA